MRPSVCTYPHNSKTSQAGFCPSVELTGVSVMDEKGHRVIKELKELARERLKLVTHFKVYILCRLTSKKAFINFRANKTPFPFWGLGVVLCSEILRYF
jgi:hypothetical protein